MDWIAFSSTNPSYYKASYIIKHHTYNHVIVHDQDKKNYKKVKKTFVKNKKESSQRNLIMASLVASMRRGNGCSRKWLRHND